jgi:CheY-like chemotaxis protein
MSTRVLLVAEEPLLVVAVTRALMDGQYDARVTTVGPEAVSVCANIRASLVVADLSPSEEGTLDVLHDIRAREETRDVPVILVGTTGGRTRTVEAAREAGAQDLVVRPLLAGTLVARVAKLLGQPLPPLGDPDAIIPDLFQGTPPPVEPGEPQVARWRAVPGLDAPLMRPPGAFDAAADRTVESGVPVAAVQAARREPTLRMRRLTRVPTGGGAAVTAQDEEDELVEREEFSGLMAELDRKAEAALRTAQTPTLSFPAPDPETIDLSTRETLPPVDADAHATGTGLPWTPPRVVSPLPASSPLGGGSASPPAGSLAPWLSDEQAARLLTPREGTFKEGQLPSLLWACWSQRVTGGLDLWRQGDDPERTLFLEDGRPVLFRGRLHQDGVEQMLLARGFINAAQAVQARVQAPANARTVALALADQGVLKPREIFVVVRDHLKDRYVALAEWPSGAFSFTGERAPEAERVAVDEGTEALLWRAIRRKYPLERLVPVLGGPSAVLVPNTRTDLHAFGLREQELRAVTALDGAHTLEDAVQSVGVPEETVYQVAFLLVSAGLARLSTSCDDGPLPRSPPVTADAEIDRRRVLNVLARCREEDYFRVLGLPPGATREEVRDSLEALRGLVDPARFTDPVFTDLQPALQEVNTVLEECGAVLLDDVTRVRYRAHLK